MLHLNGPSNPGTNKERIEPAEDAEHFLRHHRRVSGDQRLAVMSAGRRSLGSPKLVAKPEQLDASRRYEEIGEEQASLAVISLSAWSIPWHSGAAPK